jgi:hypothetical protein
MRELLITYPVGDGLCSTAQPRLAICKQRDSMESEADYGVLAQLGERNAGSVEVIGSIPIGSTIFDIS